MSGLAFSKLNGSGNDFVLIDNRDRALSRETLSRLARTLCERKFSIGADGLIAIEPSEAKDFQWQFFNSDGSEAEMCGNGGRCAARFAVERQIAGPELCFETLAGPIRAQVRGKRVKLEMTRPEGVRFSEEIPLQAGPLEVAFLNTGVPHVVVCVEDLESVNVKDLGREIRMHERFQPAGTNVNFICRFGEGRIGVRTYERGVEDETLACGTGSVAGALVAAHRWGYASPVSVHTCGGEILTVHAARNGDNFEEVYLEGDTHWVYDGICTEEALEA